MDFQKNNLKEALKTSTRWLDFTQFTVNNDYYSDLLQTAIKNVYLNIFLAVCIPGTFQNAPGSCAECDEGSYTYELNTANACTACSTTKADTTTQMGAANSSALCGKISKSNCSIYKVYTKGWFYKYLETSTVVPSSI